MTIKCVSVCMEIVKRFGDGKVVSGVFTFSKDRENQK